MSSHPWPIAQVSRSPVRTPHRSSRRSSSPPSRCSATFSRPPPGRLESVDILQTYSPLVPTFELWSDPATIGLLAESFRSAGASEATAETLTQLRVLSGIPLFGTDIRDRDLPQETAPTGTQSRALHFAKGCYLGQEIVERIHSRGAVKRAFTGFLLTGELPTAGTFLAPAAQPDKPVGELTSVTRIGDRILGLGYLRRDTPPTGSPLSLVYPGGTAVPTTLPFASQPAS